MLGYLAPGALHSLRGGCPITPGPQGPRPVPDRRVRVTGGCGESEAGTGLVNVEIRRQDTAAAECTHHLQAAATAYRPFHKEGATLDQRFGRRVEFGSEVQAVEHAAPQCGTAGKCRASVRRMESQPWRRSVQRPPLPTPDPRRLLLRLPGRFPTPSRLVVRAQRCFRAVRSPTRLPGPVARSIRRAGRWRDFHDRSGQGCATRRTTKFRTAPPALRRRRRRRIARRFGTVQLRSCSRSHF